MIKRKKKSGKAAALLIIVLVAIMGISAKVVYAFVCWRKDYVDIYDAYYDPSWKLATVSLDVVEESDFAEASSPYSTVAMHQAFSLGTALSDTRSFNWGGQLAYVWPVIEREEVEIYKEYTPGSTIYITGITTYDNVQTAVLDDALVQYALDVLWSFMTYVTELPLPSPWGLISNSGTSRVTVTPLNPDHVVIKYDYCPSLASAHWLTYVDKPVYQGWYSIAIDAKVDIYDAISYSGYFYKQYVSTADILLFDSFYVYVG